MATANPNPARIADLTWKFWLDFKALCPSAQLSGIYANKPGYHNQRNALPAGDYSRVLSLDLQGPGDKASAIDLTLPLADMKKYSARLLNSGKDPNDPRGNYLREFYGNVDGNSYVDGWDFQRVGPASSDSSHLWHIHISFIRKYLNDPAMYRALMSILRGESVLVWKTKEWALSVRSQWAGTPPVTKPPVVAPLPPKPPAPKPVTIPTVTIKRGSTYVNGVRYLQYLLTRNGFKVTVDGDFGPLTDAAVRKFQASRRLVVDGIVGPATWKALLGVK